ncbi:MAG: hypothetical protein Q8P05_03270 [Candidatus Diapherotrites archaeon]|nr:hypothetical protein [Candidatus Diapherotrites archaeon]
METSLSKVPRRLRRYYRHGEPIPPQMASSPSAEKRNSGPRGTPVKWKRNSQPEVSPDSDEHDESEPWMRGPSRGVFENVEAARGKHRHERQHPDEKSSSSASIYSGSPEINPNGKPSSSGLFGRVSNLFGGKKPPLHHALGLKQTPSSSSSTNQNTQSTSSPFLGTHTASTEEIEQTLAELRRNMHSGTVKEPGSPSPPREINPPPQTVKEIPPEKKSLTRFQFSNTLPGSARDEKEMVTSSNPSEETPVGEERLSPRERMEQRRARAAKEQPSTPPSSAPKQSPPISNDDPAEAYARHYRRQRGQLEEGKDNRPSIAPAAENTSQTPTPDLDVKDLLGEAPTSPKKKKKTDELELPSDEEMADLPLLDDDD